MAKKKEINQTILLPKGLTSDRRDIGAEALRIHESAVYSSQSQFEQAKIWRALKIWLGASAAVAAALAASTMPGGRLLKTRNSESCMQSLERRRLRRHRLVPSSRSLCSHPTYRRARFARLGLHLSLGSRPCLG
jgi:hypothetical protein